VPIIHYFPRDESMRFSFPLLLLLFNDCKNNRCKNRHFSIALSDTCVHPFLWKDSCIVIYTITCMFREESCICYNVTFSVHHFSGQFLSIAVSACILPRSPRNSVCGATSRCIIRFCSQHSSTQLRPTSPMCGTTDVSTLVRSITLFVYVFITCIPMGSCNFSFEYT